MQSVQRFVDGSVTDAFILIITFCICWFFWPLLLALLDCSTSDMKSSVSTAKVGKVFAGADLDPDEVSTQADESEEDSSIDSEIEDSWCVAQATTSSTAALFEHYGLFGASPATWCNHAQLDVEEIGDEIDDEESEDSVQSIATGCHVKAADLCEHYGLFGASPGAWSGSASDTSLDDREDECESDDSYGVLLPSAAALFEHYGLFDAAPDAWASKT